VGTPVRPGDGVRVVDPQHRFQQQAAEAKSLRGELAERDARISELEAELKEARATAFKQEISREQLMAEAATLKAALQAKEVENARLSSMCDKLLAPP
jgi:multidrug efflux pump subunit AcrA (membrane-fusion protein)